MTGSNQSNDDLRRLVDAAVDRWGRIDALVNSAGHGPRAPIIELTDEQWHTGMDTYFLNAVRPTRLVTPIMQAQKSGAIVNISTFAAFEPDPVFPTSGVFRAGLAAFTKLYADKYAADNIRMNNVLPGFIDSLPENEAFKERIPMGRYGTVDEVSRADQPAGVRQGRLHHGTEHPHRRRHHALSVTWRQPWRHAPEAASRPAVAAASESYIENIAPIPVSSSTRCTMPDAPASTTTASGSSRSGRSAVSSTPIAAQSRNVAADRSITKCQRSSAIRRPIADASWGAVSRSRSPSMMIAAPWCDSTSDRTTRGVVSTSSRLGTMSIPFGRFRPARRIAPARTGGTDPSRHAHAPVTERTRDPHPFARGIGSAESAAPTG